MTEREEIFRAIQQCLAGHSERDGISALISSLVVAIGVSCESLAQARRIINDLPAEMVPALIGDWEKFRRHRAKAQLRADVEAHGMH